MWGVAGAVAAVTSAAGDREPDGGDDRSPSPSVTRPGAARRETRNISRPSVRCGSIRGMADAVDLWDLLDRLDAAAEDSESYHHDLCTAIAGQPCSCGAGRLYIDAAAFLRAHAVEQTIRQAQQAA